MTGRRAALALLGSAALAPRAWARDAVRVVGYLSNGAGKEVLAEPLARFGYVEDRNIRFEDTDPPSD